MRNDHFIDKLASIAAYSFIILFLLLTIFVTILPILLGILIDWRFILLYLAYYLLIISIRNFHDTGE